MNYKKIITVLIFCNFILVSGVLYAETLRAGFFQHPPHHYKTKTGQIRGATVTYFNLMAKKMGYDVEWVGPLPFSRLLSMLKRGELDIYPHSIYNPDWKKFLYYPKKYYYLAQPILVVRKDNPLTKIESINDIRNFKINWVDGVPPSPFIQKNKAALEIKLMPFGEQLWKQSIFKIINKRVDAVHDLNAFSIPFEAKQLGLDKEIKVLRLPEPAEKVFVAISKKAPNAKQLIEKYNQVQETIPFRHEDYIKLLNKEF